ncbi:hypothetical protein [Staphylococcus saprophyticus]|nr:hypothetical protein [Staphylococcus saprophyticus]
MILKKGEIITPHFAHLKVASIFVVKVKLRHITHLNISLH